MSLSLYIYIYIYIYPVPGAPGRDQRSPAAAVHEDGGVGGRPPAAFRGTVDFRNFIVFFWAETLAH